MFGLKLTMAVKVATSDDWVRPRLIIKTISRYGNFHYKYTTVARPPYLYNGNPYTSKDTPIYLNLYILRRPLDTHGVGNEG